MYTLKQTPRFKKTLSKNLTKEQIRQFEKQKEKLKYRLIGDSLYKNILWELKIQEQRIYYIVNHKNEIILFIASRHKDEQQIVIDEIKDNLNFFIKEFF